MPTKLSGPQMQQRLNSHGIDARQVILRRETGCYVAEFYHDRMQTPVQPSAAWAQSIEECIASVVIVDRYDTVADWRPGNPVIWASVTFRCGS